MATEKTNKSDGSLNDDGIIMTSDKVEQDDADNVVVKKKASSKKPFIIAASVLLFGYVGYGMLGGSADVGTTQVATPPRMNTTSGGVNVSSNPAFLEELRRSNDANAEAARLKGETYIPTSESFLRPDESNSEAIPEAVTPAVAPNPERPAVEFTRISPPPTMPQLRREEAAPTQNSQSPIAQQGNGGGAQEQQENPYVTAMGQYFGRVVTSRVPVGSMEGDVSQSRTASSESATNQQVPVAQAGGGNYPAQQIQPSMMGEVPQLPVQSPLNTQGRGIQVSNDGYARDSSGNIVGFTDQDGIVRAQNGSAIGTVAADGSLQPFPGVEISGVASDQEVSAVEDQVKREEVFVPAGDIIYAEVMTDASSDRPEVPVIATVTVGKYEGARVIGTFSVDDQSGKLVISFSQMTLEDTTIPVRALAVDGFSGENALRSGIERRYVKRYAPVFASAFLNGLAKGLSETDQAVVGVGDSQTVVTTAKTVEESVWAGIADATGTVTDDISSRAPKGPNIKLGSGYPIGILFVEDLREDPEGED